MAKINNFEELEVWQLARTICKSVDKLLRETPLGKNYALANQMERSSGSIMDNIAEGFGRGGNAEFHNFLSYSKGSTSELKSQIYRSIDKRLIDESSFNKLINQCNILENKLGAFMFYLRKSDLKGIKFKKPDHN
uniref:four helix bundle protein n=1 Tax=uncultured Christiangramia sp. TaxID=503836 RepID=UPI002629E7B4|nr:four helix bundle protein [uncultured Christiangramia sp.]